jgi:hypothetical protein
MKKITSSSIAEQNFKNWLVVRNAYASMKSTEGHTRINEEAGRKEYQSITKALLSVANAHSVDHNVIIDDLRKSFGGASIDNVVSLADDLRSRMQGIAQNAIKAGASVEQSEAIAMNAYFGNPGYDQFAGLNLLGEQLYEQLTFTESFISEGDSIQLNPEVSASAGAISRFRLPRIEASGASKTRLGDLNPYGDDRVYGNNLAQISLLSEFKNAHTEAQGFIIEDEQQQALLGYARSISPALAGFVLQNQLFSVIEKQILQSAERIYVDGVGSSSFDGTSGNYGLLSSAIRLALASAGAASPLLATASDWNSNPTKLVQTITNYNYKPADITAPIASNADAMNVYKDIVRLLNLVALTNVATSGKVVLYVPTSLYSVLVQYLSTGTFNRTLGEALKLAVGGTIKNIEVKASGLLNARINSLGAQQYNHVVAVVHGAPVGMKGIIAPMATASPRVTTGVVSEQRSSFAASLTFAGPMVIQRGQVFDLNFSVQA